MDSDQQATLLQPTAVPHPGEVVADYLEFHGWAQRDLARRTGLTPKTISEICNGKAPITAATSLALEKVLQRPAHFWLNLQRRFDEAEARNFQLAQSAQWSNWARKFPLKEMRKLHFLNPAQSEVDALLHFLGVSSPESWDAVWNASRVAFRQTRKFATSIETVSAWVRETERVAAELQTADFDEHLLRASIEELRRLTRTRADEIMEPVQKICAAAGVAVVWVPELPHCAISGCARWLSDRKALIALTLRYKTDDQMWFTFFHEVGHVLLHRRKRSFVLDNAADNLADQVIDPEMQQYESEANQFAGDTLIPPAALGEFVRKNSFTNEDIHAFAEAIGIGPGIVVGRLQREGLLARHQGNALKQKLAWQLAEDNDQTWGQ
ncbi:HigA family addiction module antitoxin [Labrys okinawensis]|uniref:HigA family addiction module antitoxin n=1 Tax=Labrys okinawensis TaxID=346911 RepID=UPI0039BCD3B7